MSHTKLQLQKVKKHKGYKTLCALGYQPPPSQTAPPPPRSLFLPSLNLNMETVQAPF